MENNILSLPEKVKHLQIDEKNIYLLGTAHISPKSVQDVEQLIEAVQPDSVCVELCPSRYQTMINSDAWRKMNIFKILKEKKALFLLMQLILTAFYRKLGEKIGVQPGAEMLEGVKQAEKHNSQLVLADRDVNITLKRVWGYMAFWHKLKMFFQFIFGFLFQDKVDEDLIEQLKEKDQLEVIMESLGQSFPQVKKRLIDERDIYLAQKIRQAPGKNIVAIVGAGHVSGILQNIHENHDLDPLLQVPPKSFLPKLLKWSIPLIIVGLIVMSFFHGGKEHSIESITIWILANGILSSLGVVLAMAHPLTVLATFLAAPLTSLNPTIAAGWVAGLVQAWVKKPTVGDLEILPQSITSIKGFWLNPLSRILLVVVLANIGSSLGTFIAGSWIAVRFF